jgi:hypothetical protein
MSITKISPDVVDFDSALVVSPTLTIGDATAEDTKIVFDGNAQDFYIGLDDSADDLIIGLGSTVGTTPAISVDEDQKVTLPKKFTVDGADGAIDNDYVAFLRNQEGTDDRNFGLYVVGGSTSSDVAFRIDNQRTGGGNAFHINGDGKVGINIAAPARRLLEIQDASPGIVLHDSDVTNLTHEIVGGGNAGLEISADYQNVGTGYIRFDVGGSEKARILESGGITFNGDTAAANALDDYEEGTYSPVYGASSADGTVSYGAQTGWYTKVGNLVTVYVDIAPSSASGQSGLSEVSLPFTAANQFSYMAFVPWDVDTSYTGTDNQAIGYVYPNTSRMRMYHTEGSSSNAQGSININTAGRISGTIFYYTAT